MIDDEIPFDIDKIPYGPVCITAGKFKGQIRYYDDDDTRKTAICYVVHPLDFCGNNLIRSRYLRIPRVEDLIVRSEQIGYILRQRALHKDWDIDPEDLHALWSERALIVNELFETRMFGEFGRLQDPPEVFLCHSSADKGFVRKVHDDLKNIGVSCWLDENEIRAVESIVAKISVGLGSTRFLLAFLSPESVSSKWAQKEWQSVLSRALSGESVVVIPILIETCNIPSILSDIKYADFRESYDEGFKTIYKSIKEEGSK